jgi:hypothetical protein
VSTLRGGAATPVTSPHRTRHLAPFLDAVFPGLGHLAAGRRRQAAVFGLPILLLVLVGIAIVILTPTIQLVALVLDPVALATFFLIQALILVWRLIAVATSLFDPRLPRVGRRDAIPVALIALVLIVPQALAGYATNVVREVTDEIIPTNPETVGAWQPPAYSGGPVSSDFDLPSADPSGGPSASPSQAPSATPGVPRQNVLIIGVDQGIGRNTPT